MTIATSDFSGEKSPTLPVSRLDWRILPEAKIRLPPHNGEKIALIKGDFSSKCPCTQVF